MKNIRNIVATIDQSDNAQVAATHAARIAKGVSASLSVFHCIESLVVEEMASILRLSWDDAVSQVSSVARENVDATVAKLSDVPNVTGHVSIGSPAECIVDFANERNAQLIVMGARGTSSGASGVGVTASSVVRAAKAHVLLVRQQQAKPFKKVLATTDFSDNSVLAAQMAADVALAEGATLDLLHVYIAPWSRLHYRAATEQSSPDFQKQFLSMLEGKLKQVARSLELDRPGLQVNTGLQECGNHAHGILNHIEQHSFDLVVVGTRGLSKLRYLLLGTTAEKLLREVTCSLLAVRAAT